MLKHSLSGYINYGRSIKRLFSNYKLSIIQTTLCANKLTYEQENN